MMSQVTSNPGCCARGKRPRRRAAEQRDKIAPFQLIKLHSDWQDTELATVSQWGIRLVPQFIQVRT
jgi:hypothetical protein